MLIGSGNSGKVSKIYVNNGSESLGFTEQINIALDGDASSASPGDYDSDGDLDILISGYFNSEYKSILFEKIG